MKQYLAIILVAAAALTAAPAARAGGSAVKMCIVSGDDLGDDPVTITYKGRTITLCCKSCVKKFNANPAKYLAILDREMAKRNK